MKSSELFDVGGWATVVTGGASGIGLAYAEVMADNGARVALLDVDRGGLDAAVAKLKAKGGDVRGAVVDVTDRPALRAAIDGAADAFGRLDVLFANAGIDPGPRPSSRRPASAWPELRVRERGGRVLGQGDRHQSDVGLQFDPRRGAAHEEKP